MRSQLKDTQHHFFLLPPLISSYLAFGITHHSVMLSSKHCATGVVVLFQHFFLSPNPVLFAFIDFNQFQKYTGIRYSEINWNASADKSDDITELYWEVAFDTYSSQPNIGGGASRSNQPFFPAGQNLSLNDVELFPSRCSDDICGLHGTQLNSDSMK